MVFDQAEINYSWDRYAEAIEDYQKALTFTRPSKRWLISLSVILSWMTMPKDANTPSKSWRRRLTSTHSPRSWDLAPNGYPEQAWEVVRWLKRVLDKSHGFLCFHGSGCLEITVKTSPAWLTVWHQKSAPEENVLVMIGEMAMDLDPPWRGIICKRRLSPDKCPVRRTCSLGVGKRGRITDRASKKHLADAERIARQTKDADLAERVEMARIYCQRPWRSSVIPDE